VLFAPDTAAAAAYLLGAAWELAAGITDAQGRAVLRLRPSADAVFVRATGPGYVPVTHGPIVVGESPAPVHLSVSAGARLRGRTLAKRSLSFAPFHGHLKLMPPGSTDPSHALAPIRLDPGGSFEQHDLQPGTWDVFLHACRAHSDQQVPIQERVRRAPSDANSRGGLPRTFLSPVATVTLRAGETTELVINGDLLAACRITGVVQRHGAPMPNTKLRILLGSRDGRGGIVRRATRDFTTDASGAFELEDCDPGSYAIEWPASEPRAPARRVKDWFTLRPGVHQDLVIEVGA
jgi:hypothetical protein